MSANTITLNGKVYDSTTGTPVGAKTHPKPQAAAHKPATSHVRVHHTAAHKTPHKAQKTRTLMRHAVKKPIITATETVIEDKATAHDETMSFFLPQLSESRLKRAKQVHKSTLITRFGTFGSEPAFVKRSAHVPVKPHPADGISHHETVPAVEAAQHGREDLFAGSLHQAAKPAHAPAHPKHHRRQSHKKSSRSALAASVVAIALLGGFFAYQNKPNMEFRVAAARSGVHASLPGYHPSGFAIRGPIEYAPGQLTINFKSNSDDRNFNITQKVSNWNSAALLDNYVAQAGGSYQAVEDNGRTIYLYGNGNATWVNGGVWYQVESGSSLTNPQLVKIASSI